MIHPREKYVHFCIHALEMGSIIRKHCKKLRESLVKKWYKYKKYYTFYLSICCNWKYIYLGTFEAVCWWFYDLVTFSFIFRHSVTFLKSSQMPPSMWKKRQLIVSSSDHMCDLEEMAKLTKFSLIFVLTVHINEAVASP